MLTLTTTLNRGPLQIRSAATGKLLAHTTISEGHDIELDDLKSYLRQYVFNSANILLDGKQIGTWTA